MQKLASSACKSQKTKRNVGKNATSTANKRANGRGRQRGGGIGGRGSPGMAPARATRCGSSAASIEIPNNRVECTCTACAATRHRKKRKVNEREENPKTKMLREKMQKCATKRSAKRDRGAGGVGRVAGGGWSHQKEGQQQPKAGAAKCSSSDSSRDTSTRCNE